MGRNGLTLSVRNRVARSLSNRGVLVWLAPSRFFLRHLYKRDTPVTADTHRFECAGDRYVGASSVSNAAFNPHIYSLIFCIETQPNRLLRFFSSDPNLFFDGRRAYPRAPSS